MEGSLFIEMVEGAAEARGDTPVPREYIFVALDKINHNEIDVERYPLGSPSLKGVYRASLDLYLADQKIH